MSTSGGFLVCAVLSPEVTEAVLSGQHRPDLTLNELMDHAYCSIGGEQEEKLLRKDLVLVQNAEEHQKGKSAMKIRLFEDMLHLNQAFETIVSGLENLEKERFFNARRANASH